MKDITLLDALTEAFNSEYANSAACEEHKFSSRHEHKMKRLFNQYERSQRYSRFNAAHPSFRKRMTAALIAALIAVAFTSTAVGNTPRGFTTEVYPDHTHIEAVYGGLAPVKIEKVYEIANVPEGFVMYTETIHELWVVRSYERGEYGKEGYKHFLIEQSTREQYMSNVNTEYYELETLDINGSEALFIDFDGSMYLVWQQDGYIFTIHGSLPKEETIDLVKSNKFFKN